MEIYLDNAATSFPKPESVYQAVYDFMRNIGVNAGRGAYRRALAADKIIYETRRSLAKLFGIKEISRIVFTANVTEAINLALKGILQSGDHVVTTTMEHNVVWRPLKALERERGVKITAVPCDRQGRLTPRLVEEAINGSTRLIVLLHASNVTGTIMPVAEVGAVARRHGIPMLVDAAQTAGVLPIDVEGMGIDLLAFTGHKGLLGPMGTGGLYIRPGLEVKPLKEGGTGGDSLLEEQPPHLPDRLEAGTPNVSGIAGLKAAVEFILQEGVETIRKKEERLSALAWELLAAIPGVTLYGPPGAEERTGVISFNIEGLAPAKVGAILDEEYGIMVRTGLHCAPCAHRTIGTVERGTVRIGIGYFNTEAEIERLAEAVATISRRKGG